MNLIDLAKQFGEEIQNDELYIKVRMNEQKLETDEKLQRLMGEFNEHKSEINREMAKDNPDEEKIKSLNKLISEEYEKISKNANMVEYQNSQKEFMEVMNKVNSIILRAAQGENPYLDDEEGLLGCSGSCSSCDGCY